MLALAGREVRRVLSLWTQTILPPAVTALLFLLIFGRALGGRIREIDGVEYGAFILPGLLVMTAAAQAAANASTSLFQAKNEGYLEDVLSSPLRGWHIVAGYVSGGVVRSLAAVALVAAVAAPLTAVPEQPALVALTLVLTAVIFAGVGTIVGVWADTFDQHSFVSALVITPLALVGGVFYSARTLAEPWRTLTRLDPIYYLVDATRAGSVGVHESGVAVALAVAAVVSAAVIALAALVVERGWRLKP